MSEGTHLEGERNSWIGRTLSGRYHILDVIGHGGMGVIFRARQLSVDRLVAIKMMHARASQSEDNVARFHREAQACSKLTHPNTIRLYDFGQTTLGNFYMVMELLEGRSLRQVIQDEAPISAPRVLRMMMQCCASLAEAHAAGIIHRDIKPENIFVIDRPDAQDSIKLLDFSIAKLANAQMTAIGTVFGTPQYMSPEQTHGGGIDGRSDIYSLGIVAYAMLSNTLPFHHSEPIEVLKMHRSSPVPPLPAAVPDMVAKVVMGCLQKNPDQRPASAMALLEACKVWLTTLDPNLDIAADPVLKNTLIDPGPPASMPTNDIPTSSFTQQSTLLGVEPTGTAIKAAPRARESSLPTLLHASSGVSARLPSRSEVRSEAHSTPMPPVAAEPIVEQIGTGPNMPTVAHRLAKATTPAPNPTMQQQSLASFLVACLLVAVTFGFGGYYITTALR